MAFVAGVRWTFRGKDAGRLDSGSYRGNRGRSIGASSAVQRHNRYPTRPAYTVSNLSLAVSSGTRVG
jgi:hypothetical protein